MTINEARDSLRKNIALLAQIAQGTCVRSFQDQRAIVDSDIELLIEAAKTQQAADCLAMLTKVHERTGRA